MWCVFGSHDLKERNEKFISNILIRRLDKMDYCENGEQWNLGTLTGRRLTYKESFCFMCWKWVVHSMFTAEGSDAHAKGPRPYGNTAAWCQDGRPFSKFTKSYKMCHMRKWTWLTEGALRNDGKPRFSMGSENSHKWEHFVWGTRIWSGH